ncbi:MAG: radical SAM protein [Synergistaceae bacterium]|jgi:nitrogen fixation protein NifB|nr:radical SAM protein [Synergistaceae bacterium]
MFDESEQAMAVTALVKAIVTKSASEFGELGLKSQMESGLKISQLHPCFGEAAHNKFGRLHLPVSPACNIQCRFCNRAFNREEVRPGVTAGILPPERAVETVKKALELCPDITVVGIAGPGDTLATDSAIRAFRAVHAAYPNLIKCLSTNGLMLPDRAEELIEAGVRTVTVTVNAVDPDVLEKVVSHVIFEGRFLNGSKMRVLTKRQLEGIRKVSRLGAVVRVNTVLIPGINDEHIEDIARAVSAVGAHIYNIIPLIPQHEFAHVEPPDCDMLQRAKAAGAKYMEVFHHCKHCRADACGIPGISDFSEKLYGGTMETFSHG